MQTWEIEEIQREADRHWGAVCAATRVQLTMTSRPERRWFKRPTSPGSEGGASARRRRRLPAV